MKRKDFEGLSGKIVCLDLVNRDRTVCRVTDIDDDGLTMKSPVVYVLVPTNDGMQVQGIPYAGPLFEAKTVRVGFEHIIAVLDVPPQMEQAYIRHVSGLVTEAKPKILVP